MGYPYFNPPYLQRVDKIEEGNFFVTSHGIEPESVHEIHPEKEKTIKIIKLIALIAAVAATFLMMLAIPAGGLF